jgi:hypothetical protein
MTITEPPTHCDGVPSFGGTSHGHVEESLEEKGPGDSIVQPAHSGAEGSSASLRVYAQNGLVLTSSHLRIDHLPYVLVNTQLISEFQVLRQPVRPESSQAVRHSR